MTASRGGGTETAPESAFGASEPEASEIFACGLGAHEQPPQERHPFPEALGKSIDQALRQARKQTYAAAPATIVRTIPFCQGMLLEPLQERFPNQGNIFGDQLEGPIIGSVKFEIGIEPH